MTEEKRGDHFIVRYEKEMKGFEKNLKNQVSDFIDKNNGEATTHDIVVFLQKQNELFRHLYEENYNKAWYRLRKVLLDLNLKREFSVGKTEKLYFPNYKWSKNNKNVSGP